MKQKAYRLTQARYADTAYAGLGSLRRNGRWHRAGIPVVYAAESAAVALLEVLVHIERTRLLTMNFVVVESTFDVELMERVAAYVESEGLEEGWRSFPWSAAKQQIGQRWFEARRSVILEVPSAVVPRAKNYLFNPEHPRFNEVILESPMPFEVDPRLGH